MTLLRKERSYRVLTLAAWFLFFGILLVTGNVQTYLNRMYTPLVAFAALLLLAILVFEIRRLPGNAGPEVSFMKGIGYAVFLVPILLCVAVRPGGLSTLALSTMSTGTDFQAGKGDVLRALQAAVETEDRYRKFTIKQLVILARGKPGEVEGRLVSVEGLMYRDKETSDRCVLVRYLITCCIAHARPMTVSVLAENMDLPPNDIWVKARGTVSVRGGKPFIIADNVAPAPRPPDTYLY